jgi:hypothetical protein
MPNSTEFKRFPVDVLGGGISLWRRASLTPPGRWRKAKGWAAKQGSALRAEGFRTYLERACSPEFQDYFQGGACDQLTNLNLGGSPTGFGTLIGPNPTLSSVMVPSEWDFKLDTDPEPCWAPVLQIALLGQVLFISLSAAYVGALSGQGDWIAGQARRYALRRRATQAGLTTRESCPVNEIRRFAQPNGSETLYFFTPRDVYEFDPNTATPIRRTPTYATGTVSAISGDGLSITGNLTAWDTAGLGASMLFKMNADPETKWTRIASVGGATTLTLLEGYKGNRGLTGAYTVTKCFNAAQTLSEGRKNRWRTVPFLIGSPGPILVACNDKDRVQKLTGSGVAAALGGLDNVEGIDVQSAGGAAVFGERLVLWRTRENGTRYPRRFRWSDPLDAETWFASKARDLQGEDEIRAGVQLAGALVFLCDRSIHNITPTTPPFDFRADRKVSDLGCRAGGSAVNKRDQQILFLGPDNFYAYDLTRETPIGREIAPAVFDGLHDDMIGMACAQVIEDLGLYVCSLPFRSGGDLWTWRTFAFNFVENVWIEPFEGFLAFGDYFETTRIPINSYTLKCNAYAGRRINSRRGRATAIHLAGGRDGRIVRLFEGFDSDWGWPENELIGGITDCGYSGLKKFGWVVLEAEANSAWIDVEIGLSMNGEAITWLPAKRVYLSESTISERDLIFPVNRSAKWITYRIKTPFQNQRPSLYSLDYYWRPRGNR